MSFENKINEAISNDEFFFLQKYFNINYLIKERENLFQVQSDFRYSQIMPNYWGKIFKNLFSIVTKENYKDMFQYFEEAVKQFLNNEEKTELKVPIMKIIAASLYNFAQNGCLNQSVRILQNMLLSSLRLLSSNKLFQSPLLAVVNNTILSYFLQKNFQQADKLIDSVDMKVTEEMYTACELAKYYFLKGKTHMVYGLRKDAYQELSRALQLIPLDSFETRKHVFAHFIPVSMSFGRLPSMELLDKYSLHIYDDFAKAIASGDISLFDKALDFNQNTLIKLGVWEMIVHSKLYVERRLLEIVKYEYTQNATNDNIMYVKAFQEVLCLFGNYSIDDTILLIANLVNENLVQANVFYQHGLIIFSKSPFRLPDPND